MSKTNKNEVYYSQYIGIDQTRSIVFFFDTDDERKLYSASIPERTTAELPGAIKLTNKNGPQEGH